MVEAEYLQHQEQARGGGRVSRLPAAMAIRRWRVAGLQPLLRKNSDREVKVRRRPPEEEPVIPEITAVEKMPFR